MRLLDGNGLGQVTREAEQERSSKAGELNGTRELGSVEGKEGLLDVDTVHDSQVVREQLEGDDVDETLQAIDGVGHSDESVVSIE